METDDLIRSLSEGAAPVRRLPRPWLRALVWLAIATPPVALVVWWHGMSKSPDMVMGNTRAVIEALAMAATAITAAIAAFASEVPGASRRWLWLPLVPLAVWLVSLGEGCVADFQVMGAGAFALKADNCLVPALFATVIPLGAMALMIRRGAPVVPRVTVALAGLAVAALVNFGMILFHTGDVSLPVLVWHGGAIALVFLASGWAGPRVFGWRHAS